MPRGTLGIPGLRETTRSSKSSWEMHMLELQESTKRNISGKFLSPRAYDIPWLVYKVPSQCCSYFVLQLAMFWIVLFVISDELQSPGSACLHPLLPASETPTSPLPSLLQHLMNIELESGRWTIRSKKK